MWCFYVGFESNSPLFLVLSLIFFGLGVLTHPSIIFLLPALLAYLPLVLILKYDRGPGYTRRNLLFFVIPILLLGIFFASKYLTLFNHFSTIRGSGSLMHILHTSFYYIQVPFLILTTVTVLYLLIQRDRRGLFLGLTAFVPLIMIMITSVFSYVSSLYIYYTLPIYCLSTAYFVTLIGKQLSKKYNIATLGILFVLIFTQLAHIYSYFTFQYGDRPRWKEATHFLMSKHLDNDLVISTAPTVLEYYFQINDDTFTEKINLGNTEYALWLSEKTLVTSLNNTSRIWLITNVDITKIDYLTEKHKNWIADNFIVIKTFPAWTGGKDRTVKLYFYDTKKSDTRSF